MVQQIARRICQSELWHQFKATITLLVCSAALRQIGATISAQHIFSKVRPSMWKDSSMQSPFQHTFSDAFILKPWFARGCVLPFSCHLWNNLDEGVLCEFHEKQWQTESQAQRHVLVIYINTRGWLKIGTNFLRKKYRIFLTIRPTWKHSTFSKANSRAL